MKRAIKYKLLSSSPRLGYKFIKNYRLSNFHLQSFIFGHNKLNYSHIILASTQKTGSQWLKSFFKDERVLKKTGMLTFPQREYEYGELPRKFPRGVIPGIYCSKQYFENAISPRCKNYKVIHTIRDPRNIVCSWYHSTLYTHGYTPIIYKQRKILQDLSKDEGLLYSIDYLTEKFAALKSWYLDDDFNVYKNKIEDFDKNPSQWLGQMFSYLDLDLSEVDIQNLVEEYTREKLRQKNINYRGHAKLSHYREKTSDFKNEFKSIHHNRFSELNGNLLDLLGYD